MANNIPSGDDYLTRLAGMRWGGNVPLILPPSLYSSSAAIISTQTMPTQPKIRRKKLLRKTPESHSFKRYDGMVTEHHVGEYCAISETIYNSIKGEVGAPESGIYKMKSALEEVVFEPLQEWEEFNSKTAYVAQIGCVHADVMFLNTFKRYGGSCGEHVNSNWVIPKNEAIAIFCPHKTTEVKIEKPPIDIEKIFEKVILPKETKDEIISVLHQHQYKDTIFNKWGLGEEITYGKGMTMLFFGPPGTGKTLCAQTIADVLQQKLVVLDTATIQSPFPGEMERKLLQIFAEAKNQVLFLDECDGLIQSRAGMGQIMSAENNTLLKAIEQFEGILVMATNRIDTLDEALERRVSLIVEFPFPDEATRSLIWKRHLPVKLPLSKDVLPEDLAIFPLSGGQIKNAVLSAARYASLRLKEGETELQMDDFVRAIKRINRGHKAFITKKETRANLQDYSSKNFQK